MNCLIYLRTIFEIFVFPFLMLPIPFNCFGFGLFSVLLFFDFVANKTISDILNVPIEEAHAFFQDDSNFEYLNDQFKMISKPILKEIRERIFFFT